MQTIDMTRFGQTIMWSVISEKKQYIKNFLTMFIIYLILICASTGMFTGYKNPINIMQIFSAVSLCSLAWAIYGGLYTGEVFSNLRTKQNRTMFFMLPASNLEKYWSRVLLTMVQALVLSTVALVAADLVQMLLSSIFAGNAMSVTKTFVDTFNFHGMSSVSHVINGVTVHDSSIPALVASYSLILWLVSSYILGGTVFKKAPAVLTTLCWIVIWIVFGIGTVSILEYISNHYPDHDFDLIGTGNIEILMEIASTVISLAFCVFNMWLSYRLFTKMQITPGKYLHI